MDSKHSSVPTTTEGPVSTGPFPVYPAAIIVPVLAAVAIVADIFPAFWHIRNRNIAAGSLCLWLLFLNLAIFVNAIIWPTDDTSKWWKGVGLCDIEVYMFTGSWLGVVGALACILRGLANVLDTANTVVTTSRNDKRRQWAIDLAVCWGLPLLQMPLYFIVQPIRFFVYGISGCTPAGDNSWPSIVLIALPPVLICLVCTYYAGLVLWRLHRYRVEFSRLLAASNITRARFIRLFLMSTTLILGILPVAIYMFYYTAVESVSRGYTQSYSWSRVHGPNWNKVYFTQTQGSVSPDRWCWMCAGICVFLFFGTGNEAAEMYVSWLLKLGLGRCFPALREFGRRNGSTNRSGVSSHVDTERSYASFRDRAKSAFSTKSHDDYSPSSAATSPGSASFFKRMGLGAHSTNDGMELPFTRSSQDEAMFRDPFYGRKASCANTLVGSEPDRKNSAVEMPDPLNKQCITVTHDVILESEDRASLDSIQRLEFGR